MPPPHEIVFAPAADNDRMRAARGRCMPVQPVRSHQSLCGRSRQPLTWLEPRAKWGHPGCTTAQNSASPPVDTPQPTASGQPSQETPPAKTPNQRNPLTLNQMVRDQSDDQVNPAMSLAPPCSSIGYGSLASRISSSRRMAPFIRPMPAPTASKVPVNRPPCPAC